jgi:UDP-3-O-[3-hydroxymyristoyl] glucosamine N-acyltransferase
LYVYMHSEGKNIIGYYAQNNEPELSKYIPWIGDVDTVDIEKMDREAQYIVAVRLIKYREKMISFIEKAGLQAGSFISEKVYYSKMAQLGKEVIIFPNAMVTGNPRVGDYLFMDVFSVISHGDVMGNNIVVRPAAIIAGDCIIEDNVTFGVNSAAGDKNWFKC